MPIRFKCPTCNKGLAAAERLAGKRIRCPSCQTVLAVPAPEPVAPPPAQDEPLRFAPEEPAAEPVIPQPSPPSGLAARREARRRDADALLAATGPERVPPRRYLYLIFVLALLPLVFSLLGSDDEDDFEARIERTVETYEAELGKIIESNEFQKKIAKDLKGAVGSVPEDILQEYVVQAAFEQLLEGVPGARIDGAHLPGQTWMHWFYALLSAALFLGIILLFFERGGASVKTLLQVGLFTGTLGIIFLIGVQWVAEFTQGFWIRGRGIITLFFYILKFIGFSYRSALDPNSNFLLSAMGFTFGVGLCEELAKAIPMFSHYRTETRFTWRCACVLGLASGIGFGVSEGIMYSSDFYNGVATGGIYVVRFVSCVALHATWSAAAGVVICSRRKNLHHSMDFGQWVTEILYALAVPMVLHGLYDTMLKQDMNAWALVTALVSFGYLVWVVERARVTEDAAHRTARRRARVARPGGIAG